MQKMKWVILALWLAAFIACLPFLPKIMQPFELGGFIDTTAPSAQAAESLNKTLGFSDKRFIILYQNPAMNIADAKYLQEIRDSLSGLNQLSIKHFIIYPDLNPAQISRDKHAAYAVILLAGGVESNNNFIMQFKSLLKKPADLSMQVGGDPIFLNEAKSFAQQDLHHAEWIALPVVIIIMLLVFRSIIAADLTIIIGGISISLILTLLFFIAQRFSISLFALNIATMLGLGLTLDYSLFSVSRFREELAKHNNTPKAISSTKITAGKSILFSGLSLLISMSTLLLFKINLLISVGIAGIIVVIISLGIALTLVPAMLGILGNNINALPIQLLPKKYQLTHKPFWQLLANKIMHYPITFFVITALVLLLLGFPFIHVKFNTATPDILPASSESRQVYDTFKNIFNENDISPILVLAKSPQNTILSSKNIDALYYFTHGLSLDNRVSRMYSVVTLDPRLMLPQYHSIYNLSGAITNAKLKLYLQLSTRNHSTLISIISHYPINSPETLDLVNKIRHIHPDNMTIEVSGASAIIKDVIDNLKTTFPYAILLTIILNYFLLLFLFRSILLPLKAIIMNFLSLFVSYGMLVFIFQDGHFQQLLNFQAPGFVELTLPIIIFCTVFGISMDYEIFLLTRIKEQYEKTGNNIESVAMGMQRCGSVITSAAITLAVVCLCFATAKVVLIKALGLGTAVAVIIDATLIRALLVPATMRLLGNWNWYLPKWLDKILP